MQHFELKRYSSLTARVMMLAVATIAAFAMLAGCGTANRAADSGTEDGMRSRSYGNDGYLGMTNAHPKIPGRRMALNYASDAKLIQEAIRNLPGVAGSNVTFNASDAYVTVKIEPEVHPRDIPSVERQAASVLRFNFPRYNIHVSSLPAGK